MSRRIAGTGAVLVAAIVIAACSSAATPAPTAPAALPGTSWTLGLQGGTAPAARQLPTLVFGTGGIVSGFAGCNDYTGAFTATGPTIAVSGLRTTSSNECAPEVVKAETDYLAALGGVTAWRTETVAPTQGVLVLEPVKLLLDGPTPLAFTLQ